MATEVEQPMALGASAPAHPSASATPTSATASTPNKQSPTHSTSSAGAQSSNSKRPPRKSALTQQQKNKKRQRATQDQLTVLEMEFNKNPTPTANVRDRIAEEINMTERSVQIWFQNRRAKIKLLAKKNLKTGEDIDSIPESIRAYLAMQAMESGKGLGGSYLGRTGLLPFGHGGMLGGEQGAQGKVLIHHLTCRSLSIGKWTRVGQNTMDLIVFYSPDKCTMTYYINNEQAGYKIEYPFSYIKNIWVENNEGDQSKMSGIIIELNRLPNFFMNSSPTTNGFFQCGDFTEDLQATQCMIHHLGGNPKVLASQMAKLVSLESFMNRHSAHAYGDPHALPASAPVSPTARPSSQPNFAPPPPLAMLQEPWGMSQMHSGARLPQGHKRQRSRSVPGPVDFAMFQNQPMPSYIQPPGEMGPPQHNPNIYATVPQQPNGMATNLHINTQAGFGLEMRQYPILATTASLSEFPPSPGYFPQGPESAAMAGPGFGAPYGGAFLSPMVNADSGVPAAVSPLPFSGPAEPSIVEHSPPMSMGRPGSAELYAGHEGSCAVSEDRASLNEMYSKHTINNLPMHTPSPGFVQGPHSELDMDQLVHFDAVDHPSLSPEAAPHVGQ